VEKNHGYKVEDHLQNQFTDKKLRSQILFCKKCMCGITSVSVNYFSLTIEMQVNYTFFQWQQKSELEKLQSEDQLQKDLLLKEDQLQSDPLQSEDQLQSDHQDQARREQQNDEDSSDQTSYRCISDNLLIFRIILN